jgi:pyruvate,orthophosphate dikinase
VGAEMIKIDYEARFFEVDGLVVREGDWITIDGNTGEVYLDRVPTIQPEVIPELRRLLGWADEFRRLGVKANADVPEDARIAREYGAEGIGLLRIERMFRKPERLEKLRRVILAETSEEREKAMYELSELVKGDFKEMLSIMDGLPVTIRLIDPPLHEFLPKPEELLMEIFELERSGGDDEELLEKKRLYKRVVALTEANPMMGHRGVRVGVTSPEIYKGLAKAMLEATAELILEGKNPILQIMVPQVGIVEELRFVKENAIYPIAREVEKKYGIKVPFMVGTMIETVRSTLTADEIAEEAEFFSFGTNDLTQGTYSFSRDDVENKFLPQYLDLGILTFNPFQTIDTKGVGELVRIAVEKGRMVNKGLEIGICGEHGGDPESIYFFHRVGLDYVSASPFRILIARLAAAHAALTEAR